MNDNEEDVTQFLDHGIDCNVIIDIDETHGNSD